MASILNATTTSGLVTSADNSGSLQLATNNGTTAVTIDTSQNVGIGTSSPGSQKLHVRATSPTEPMVRAISVTPTGNGVYGQYNAKYDGTASDWYFGQGSTGAWSFWNNTGSVSERMRIAAGGDVLINTTTAGLKLTVDSGITIRSSDQSTCRLVLENTTSPGRTFSFVAGTVGVGNDNFTIYDNTAAATRVTLNAGGEFIIGTTDQGAYNLQCNGTGVWGAGAYVNGSDERIKDDIEPLESGLDVVAKLNPVTYKYKEDWSKDQSTQTGFIAQELLVALEGKNYVDGVVQQGGSEGYYSVAYQNIIPILTKAIQEQQAMIEELKAEVQALKGVK